MSSISKSFGLSSSLDEEVMVIKKPGIVSIVGYSDNERCSKSAASAAVSLRRTLSADMSSKKWLSQHQYPLKKIASSVSLVEQVEEEEEGRDQLEIWNDIQQQKKHHVENEKQDGQFDTWASMLSQKQECNSNINLPPYIHPLVKRSASSLTTKSLEICTESLGSETGSDGFSSYPPSENGDSVDDEQEQEQEEKQSVKSEEEEEFPVGKYNNLPIGKSRTRSFPPPITSLSGRGDGASLHMRPRRDNGRLVLEAVSVPSQNNFRAERQDGRLVLTFINNQEEEMKSEEKNDAGLFHVEVDSLESYREEEEDGTDVEEEVEEVRLPAPKLGGGVMNVHRLVLMMNKSVVLSNRNPTWSKKVNSEEEEVNPITPLTQSLPPRPPVARMISMTPASTTTTAAARAGGVGSLNAYEYYWKTKQITPTTTSLIGPIAQNPTISNNIIPNEKQELLVLRGNKGDNYLLPLSSKGCKEPKRSLLFWEPYCIATS
ncbi:hypothetical protein M5689_021049 [Euphorbia peplus]|nr:hypothetical protein M5689_021049 [Euphorbia peplus]